MWGSWTPAKVKMAVSGCPRNCAEATCKDVGVICVDSGYEIHFAGAAGLDIKGTELLGHVETEDEAIEAIAALTQLYREQGRYLERIYKWAKRVGLRDHPPADHGRRASAASALYDRFVFSPAIRPDRPVGRARRRQGRARVQAAGRPHPARGRGMSGIDSPWIEVGPIDRHSRCAAARVVQHAATCRSRCSARRATRCSRSRTAARTRAARLSQGIVHGRTVTCPLHNWVISLETGEATGADKGCTRKLPGQARQGSRSIST